MGIREWALLLILPPLAAAVAGWLVNRYGGD